MCAGGHGCMVACVRGGMRRRRDIGGNIQKVQKRVVFDSTYFFLLAFSDMRSRLLTAARFAVHGLREFQGG